MEEFRSFGFQRGPAVEWRDDIGPAMICQSFAMECPPGLPVVRDLSLVLSGKAVGLCLILSQPTLPETLAPLQVPSAAWAQAHNHGP